MVTRSRPSPDPHRRYAGGVPVGLFDTRTPLEPLRAEIARMKLPDGWYDGEIVVLNDKGVPDFGALQNAFDTARARSAPP